MRTIEKLRSGTADGRRDRLLWELVGPLVVVAPAYALVPVRPMGSLVYLAVVLLPIGIAGGILGADRRAQNARFGILGEGDAAHGDNDAKMGSGSGWTDFASSVGLLGLGSFLLIAILFV